MPYTYPNPPKVRIRDILSFIQRTYRNNSIFYNKNIMDEFSISASDASNRLTDMRHWKLIRYADLSEKGHGGFILTEYGKKFKP